MILFLLMGAGYFVGVAMLAADVKRRLTMLVGIGYVILLILAWLPIALRGGALANSPLAYFDKIVELLLLALLLMSVRR